jgi:3-methyladenine DNA glycosylase AlkD
VTARNIKSTGRQKAETLDASLGEALDWLQAHGSKSVVAAMGPKYGIHTDRAFGVPMAQMKVLAKHLGTNHALAGRLWDTGWYEARMVASMIDDPSAVTASQMDRWCKDFDNWAIVDTVCFNLFDRTPHAWRKVEQWAKRKDEFVKRTAFALLWSLALHDKDADDKHFIAGLALIEREAYDERNFVTKAIAMALRAIGQRNAKLTKAAQETAARLADSDDKAARAIGRRAVRELSRQR